MAEVQPKQQVSRPISQKKKRKIRVTSKNIDSFQERLYLENISSLVEVGYKQLLAGMRRGDMKCLEIGLQVANLYKPRTGQVNVVTQIYNKNGGESSESEKAQSLERILRRLEASEGKSTNARDAVVDV